jgi:hypothetical protein
VFRRTRHRREATPPEDVLRLQREAQALRLELAEREATIARLEADLQRERDTEVTRTETRARAEVERLLAGSATPLVQLATQTQLAKTPHGSVDAASVLAVARALVRDFEDEGVEFLGRAGATEPYDPARHEPLGDGPLPEPGGPVVVRIVGLASRGAVIHRAGVEAG